ncbi:MAG: hypothetical protein J5959_21080, partial [Butyrivibrio sp.]|nr:hypothetical protein [Butyrivibrio sp.]
LSPSLNEIFGLSQIGKQCIGVHLMRFCLLGSAPPIPLIADFHRQAMPAKQAKNEVNKCPNIY